MAKGETMEQKCLVVSRTDLFGENNEKFFNGFMKKENNDFENIINNKKTFLLRKTTSEDQKIPCEDDPSFQQIIPYIVFKHKDKIFVYKRLPKADEQRLHDNYSIGVGGHIDKADLDNENYIVEAMKREFNEEMLYNDDFDLKIIGYINDDSNDVGKVHFGVVFLVEGSSPNIEVKETDQLQGQLMSKEEITPEIIENFETWSKIAFDNVKELL